MRFASGGSKVTLVQSDPFLDHFIECPLGVLNTFTAFDDKEFTKFALEVFLIIGPKDILTARE